MNSARGRGVGSRARASIRSSTPFFSTNRPTKATSHCFGRWSSGVIGTPVWCTTTLSGSAPSATARPRMCSETARITVARSNTVRRLRRYRAPRAPAVSGCRVTSWPCTVTTSGTPRSPAARLTSQPSPPKCACTTSGRSRRNSSVSRGEEPVSRSRRNACRPAVVSGNAMTSVPSASTDGTRVAPR
jgi:hypothetical protein